MLPRKLEPLAHDRPSAHLTSRDSISYAAPVDPTWTASRSTTSEGLNEDGHRHVVAFEPKLSLEPLPVLIFERRLINNDEVVATTLLWALGFGDPDDAVRHHEWLLSRPERWTVWGRLHALTGQDPLVEELLAGVEADRRRERDERDAALMRAERDAELARTIESRLVDGRGSFGLTLQRGGEVEPFWTILFRERWERERFRDWWSFQRHRFREFARFLETRPACDLERALLDEMLKAERAAKKAGMSAGGRRPLRFWRGEA